MFTLADAAAAPVLFYADCAHQISERCAPLKAYRTRLLARPFRSFFPLGAPDPH